MTDNVDMGYGKRVLSLGIVAFGVTGCLSQDLLPSSLIPSLASTSVTAPSTGPSSPGTTHATPTPIPSPTSAPASPSATPLPAANPGSAASYFPSTLYFNQAIDTAAVDSQSSTIMSTLNSAGGWGTGLFRIDFSIDVYYTDANTVRLPFKDDGVIQPDSDSPAHIPVAQGTSTAGFESSQGRTCDGGDCHYLSMDTANNMLTEVYHANDVTSSFFGTDAIVTLWPFFKSWPSNFRGDTCTSSDAGGLMIAPMLASAEEISAGAINHAVRLILPNSRIAYRTYVRPATHTTGASGWGDANTGVPYGARFRLKSSFNIASLPTAGARTVATALKKYGMILADGGNIALTFKSDAHTTAKYGSVLQANDLNALQVSDFEMIEGGTRYRPTYLDCTRAP